MTDAWMIEVIAKRLDCECPFAKAASILNHQSWTDIVEHLWKDKDLKVSLMKAYATEINRAREHELLVTVGIITMKNGSEIEVVDDGLGDTFIGESDSLPL